MRPRRTYIAAAAWGLAEATVFFIVPDVFLSWVALKNTRKALLACLWALVGSLIGGTIIWYLGSTNPEPVRAVFAALPAINDGMLATVQSQLEDSGLVALFIGPLIGTPYKIYALEAASLGFSLGALLLVSIPARLLRFVIVVTLAAIVSHYLQRIVTMHSVRKLHGLAWVGFYTFYFYVMS